ncbi:hypothetical protein IJK16_02290 [Candidatus Saccharibacteria bacterium]|nr:hypothetical protein [Candidatus Saccharibacteria bacterium]
MKFLKNFFKANYRGDTIVEVTFAIAMFCVVAVISISIMNDGLNSAQSSLEITMARNEIDAQAEALRFVHDSYISQMKLSPDQQQYKLLWEKIVGTNGVSGLVNTPEQIAEYPILDCNSAYELSNSDNLYNDKGFILNTRLLVPANVDSTIIKKFFAASGDTTSISYQKLTDYILIDADKNIVDNPFVPATVYPRIIYTTGNNQEAAALIEGDTYSRDYRKLSRAEGIWILAVRDASTSQAAVLPTYYDFYIRTCWYPPGKEQPNTIATIIRLYNPGISN